jgi:hypothetical protein
MHRGFQQAARVLASLALTVGLAVTWTGSASAAYPGVAGGIVFVRGGNIWTIGANGYFPNELTGDGRASEPRWAPGGLRIAYLFEGNLWEMYATGGHKIELTDDASRYTYSRPTWSPNGRYLAYVKTAKGARYGYLTRYNFTNGVQVTYTDTINPHRGPIPVAALPGPVAWTHASNGGYYIAYEGAAAQCSAPYKYCLNLLGFPSQGNFKNVYPSSEYSHRSAVRFTDPDWYPINPRYYSDLIVTSENCPAGHCTVNGTTYRLTHLVLPGSYQAVFAPNGRAMAYVENVHGTPTIYWQPADIEGPHGTPTKITDGTQPDWEAYSPAR